MGNIIYNIKMKHIAALMLLKLSKNEIPSEYDIEILLNILGAKCNQDNIKRLFSRIKNKDINKLINEGKEKLVIVDSDNCSNSILHNINASKDDNKAEQNVEKEEEESSVAVGELFGDTSSK